MPEQILFPHFRDQYDATKYPFTAWPTLQSQGTSHAIDQDLFVDASLLFLIWADEARSGDPRAGPPAGLTFDDEQKKLTLHALTEIVIPLS
ncbi:MAG: hypothetical protein KDA78_20410 [Planctomycetaceae bacterium]|nr:hypothetical protein [Planctomycetaceae bacterium]